MMVMVMTMVNHNHHLRLRRIRHCEAEEEHEAEQNLFHSSQYAAGLLRSLSYCDHCLLCRDELANRAVVPPSSSQLGRLSSLSIFFYSSRRAAIGSMRAARQAGSQLASSAMLVITAVMIPKTKGSFGLTS